MSSELRDANRWLLRAGETDRRSLIPLLAAGVAFLTLAGKAQAQQIPIPTTGAEVPGPASGTAMTIPYVQSVGRTAYMWGWPLVNMANRGIAFSKAPEPGLMGGVIPVAFNRNAMLIGYISPNQTFIACPNQDVAYGAGFMTLDKEPIVFQVPDFDNRFWVYAHYDARTDELSEIGKQYGTKPGFYMMVGPNWKGETPAKSRPSCVPQRRWFLPFRASSLMTAQRIKKRFSR